MFIIIDLGSSIIPSVPAQHSKRRYKKRLSAERVMNKLNEKEGAYRYCVRAYNQKKLRVVD